MKFSSTTVATLFPALLQAAAINKRQNEIPGEADATQADLSARPPHRFPFPVTVFPTALGDVVTDDTIYVPAGTTFDCGMKRYSRPAGFCNEQAEGTDADAVFNLLPGSTLRNCIIGKDQSEGVHALGDAWVENVWWEDVCEDALTSKGLNTQLRVIGGGALNATDKIFQDNSLGGKYNITGFYAHTFGTFYQSCGNCLNQAKRNATIENSIALFGTRLGIISPNFDGDEIRIKNTYYTNITEMVTKEIGNNVQTAPIHMGSGPDPKYALYNLTRDNILQWEEGTKPKWQYIPADPYPWLAQAWPKGYN